jgi:predicted aspartyl protease
MPILHVQIQAQAQTPDGKTVTIHPAMALQQRGPVLQVVVSVEQNMAQALQQQGQTVPAPKSGFALIDTGASFTCIDEQAAKDLALPIIDVVTMSSASHAQHQCNVYPVQIAVPPMLNLQVPRAVGAALAAQGLLALIGRDVLQNCLLVYNGGTGSISLSL